MKKIYSIVSIICCLLSVSCFEVEEKTTFKTAESGDYAIAIDMGKMIAQMKMFGAADKLNEMGIKDTISYFKNIIEKDTALSMQEKDAIRNGHIKIHFDEGKEEMNIALSAPFNNIDQLKIMRNALFKMVASNAKMPIPGFDNRSEKTGPLDILDMNSLGFLLQTEKGSITNTLTNAELLKSKLESDSMLLQIKQLAPMMGSTVVYKSVYTFPVPVKDFKAVNGKISDDRKTVIIKNEFDELFENPKAFEYQINY